MIIMKWETNIVNNPYHYPLRQARLHLVQVLALAHPLPVKVNNNLKSAEIM